MEELKEDNPDMISPGLDTNVCLYVNDEVMDAIIDGKEDSDTEPWIAVVDLSFNPVEKQYPEYGGFFKFSPRYLITELYPALLVDTFLSQRLSMNTPEDIFGSKRRLGKEKDIYYTAI